MLTVAREYYGHSMHCRKSKSAIPPQWAALLNEPPELSGLKMPTVTWGKILKNDSKSSCTEPYVFILSGAQRNHTEITNNDYH